MHNLFIVKVNTSDASGGTAGNLIESVKSAADKFDLARLIITVILIILMVVSMTVMRRIFNKVKASRNFADKGRRTWIMVLHSLIQFGILIFFILVLLDLHGVNITGFVAGLGIAGAAGALAVQDVLKDTIMGITIITDKFFSVGDVIEYNDDIGQVTEMTMRSMKYISLRDESVTTVSNHHLTQVKVTGRMRSMLVPLPYELTVADTDKFFKDLEERVAALELIEKCGYKGPNKFQDSYVEHLFLYFCDPLKVLPAKRAVTRAVIEEMEAFGIAVPFPQLDIHEK